MPVAIITGASKGLGRALGAALAERGWDLVLDARDPGPLAGAAGGLAAYGTRVAAVPGDVTDAGHRTELVARARELGGVDLVVHNASALGAEPLVPLAELAPEGLRRALEVNVVAAHALVREALPLLRESAGGRGGRRQLGRGGGDVRDVGRVRGLQSGARPPGGGAGRGGAGAAGVGGGPRGHGDRPVRGGRTGRRRSAARPRRAWRPRSCGCWTNGRRAAATVQPALVEGR